MAYMHDQIEVLLVFEASRKICTRLDKFFSWNNMDLNIKRKLKYYKIIKKWRNQKP